MKTPNPTLPWSSGIAAVLLCACQLLALPTPSVSATAAGATDSLTVSAQSANSDDEGQIGDQRSRRKRLDALLEEYMRRPSTINFDGSATAILQAPIGDSNNISTASGSFDLFVTTNLGDGTLVFVNLEARGGNGPNENISTLVPLNADAGSLQSEDDLDRIHVLEAWAEFTAFGGSAKFTAGKIDLTNYFDNNAIANDETSQFISGAFVNSAAFPAPLNSPGIRLRAEFNTGFVQLATASSDNSGNRIFDELFAIAGTGFHIPLKEVTGTYRVYGYIDGSADNTTGIGLSLNQPVGSSAQLFGRWNRNARRLGESLGIHYAWSAGVQFDAEMFEREFVVGSAFGVTAPPGSLDDELLFETYARVQFNEWIHVSPHVQFVWNAGGVGDDYFIPGFRTQFDF